MSLMMLFFDFYKNVKKFALRLTDIMLFVTMQNNQDKGVICLFIFSLQFIIILIN